jgi:hypothetical protein
MSILAQLPIYPWGGPFDFARDMLCAFPFKSFHRFSPFNRCAQLQPFLNDLNILNGLNDDNI